MAERSSKLSRAARAGASTLLLLGLGCAGHPYYGGGYGASSYLGLAEIVGRSAAAYGAYRAMDEVLDEFERLPRRAARVIPEDPPFGYTDGMETRLPTDDSPPLVESGWYIACESARLRSAPWRSTRPSVARSSPTNPAAAASRSSSGMATAGPAPVESRSRVARTA